MVGSPNPALLDVIRPAYVPCEFFGVCREAKWEPCSGHIPRGFLGATGSLADVEVIVVLAEPGHPYADQRFDPQLTSEQIMFSGIVHVHQVIRSSKDPFHRNLRWFLAELYPDLSFEDQLRHVWITEGRLCSIDDEIGNVRDHTCARNYLAKQIALLPNATVVGFGGKAKAYLTKLKIDYIGAHALAPPGANLRPARPSWNEAIRRIRLKRTARKSVDKARSSGTDLA